MAESSTSAQVTYRTQSLDSVQIRGVTKEYNDIPSTQIEVGRPITPGEFDAGRFVAILGWDVADQLFGQVSPLDKMVKIAGVHFRVGRRRAKEGHDFRAVAGSVRGGAAARAAARVRHRA